MNDVRPGLVSIVIPAYNCAGILAKCLDSVCDQSVRDFEVIVVDNGSNDGTGDVARSYAARLPLRVIRLDPNRGFTGGSNAGMNDVRGEFVLLLNSDVELHADFLREGLRAFAADPKAGAAGGTVYDLLPGGRTDRLQSNGNHLASTYRLRSYRTEDVHDGRRIFGPSAVAALLRTAALDDVRFANGQILDERFWCNGEDIDLWMRLLHRGWTVRYAAGCVCWHQGSMAFGGAVRIWQKTFDVQRVAFRNRYYVLGGTFPVGLLLRDLPMLLAADLGGSVLLGLRNPRIFFAFLSARWDALRDLGYIAARRREIFAGSRVSGRDIGAFLVAERSRRG